jgi:hypothetical protein
MRSKHLIVRHSPPVVEPRLKPFNQIAAVAVAGAALFASAAVVQAQPQGPGSGPGPGQYGQQQPDLHALLHITPDQEGAWQAYKTAAPQPQEIQALRINPQQLATMTTPQRLDRINTMMTTQLTVFHRQATAARGLYGVLSPDQRRTFDQVTAPNQQGRGAPPQR